MSANNPGHRAENRDRNLVRCVPEADHVASDIAPSRARGSLRCLASRSAAPNIRISTLLLRVLKLDPELTREGTP